MCFSYGKTEGEERKTTFVNCSNGALSHKRCFLPFQLQQLSSQNEQVKNLVCLAWKESSWKVWKVSARPVGRLDKYLVLILYCIHLEYTRPLLLQNVYALIHTILLCFPTFFCSRHPFLVFKIFGGTPG
jgi:hypothetical protein